jgi:O-antigen ligase
MNDDAEIDAMSRPGAGTVLAASRSSLSRAVFLLALVHCFFASIPHFTAIENVTFYPLIVGLFTLTLRNRGTSPTVREPITASIVMLSLIFLLVSALSPYAAESLNAWRKDFMPALVVYLALLWTVNSQKRIIITLMVVAAGIALRLMLVIVELWLLHHSLLDAHPSFVDPYTGATITSAFYGGFPLMASPFVAIGAATLLRRDLVTWQRLVVAFALIGAVAIVLDYGSRAPLVAMVGGLAVIPFFSGFSRRTLGTIFAATALATMFVWWQEPQVVNRYLSILHSETYTYEGAEPGDHSSVNYRRLIRQGIVEIADQRPLTGYGYGWKKLSTVVADGGFLERWKSDPKVDPFVVSYFSRGYGGINPHNLAVQLYFESGWLGICAFIAMLGALLFRMTTLYRRNALHERAMVALGTGFLSAWLLANVANSLWSDEKLPFVVFALIAAAWALPGTGQATPVPAPSSDHHGA